METTTSSSSIDTTSNALLDDSAPNGSPADDSASTDTRSTGSGPGEPAPGDTAGAGSGAAGVSGGSAGPAAHEDDGDRAPVDPEKEGDVAADYLEELLDIADLDGDIDLDVEGDRAVVSLVGGDLEVLVGPQGTVLEALQDLTRLAVLRSTGHRSRLLLDVDGWRSRRRDQIRARASDAVELARSSGEPVALPPMSAYERKVVHDVVAEAGLVSSSDGEDPNRHVVIRPA